MFHSNPCSLIFLRKSSLQSLYLGIIISIFISGNWVANVFKSWLRLSYGEPLYITSVAKTISMAWSSTLLYVSFNVQSTNYNSSHHTLPGSHPPSQFSMQLHSNSLPLLTVYFWFWFAVYGSWPNSSFYGLRLGVPHLLKSNLYFRISLHGKEVDHWRMDYWKGAHGYVVGDSTIYWVLKGFGAVTDTESVGVGLKLNLVYVKNL